MSDADVAYRVLARKYRPIDFDGLIGQHAMVQVLTNAFAADRIAHAFVLTGVRGVGKTTTARIIARALNCVGPDKTGGPTIAPCGVCANCVAIGQDRHVDVVEMDAASNTGVNDVRELIDGARYRPVSARYKIHIIDEAHMLSNNAFNALLKTLEEPPPHVKFIFATTELRKLPITVLSRCQRFDLRRVPAERLKAHFAMIAQKEQVAVDEDALSLIARAADGSVRDGLSLLDQAIALAGGATATAAMCRDMLGQADRAATFDLLEALFSGKPDAALSVFDTAMGAGVDPGAALEDALDATHAIARALVDWGYLDDPALPELERTAVRALAERLTQAAVARQWRLLLKGLQDAHYAPNARQAAEMALIRCAYAADLPDPGALARKILDAPPAEDAGEHAPTPPSAGPALRAVAGGGSAAVAAAEPAPGPAAAPTLDLAAIAEIAQARGDMILYAHLWNDARPGRIGPGLLELDPGAAPPEFLGALRARLQAWTDARWSVAAVAAPDAPTLAELAAQAQAARRATIESHPLVAAALAAFPGARIVPRAAAAAPPLAREPALEDPVPAAVDDPDESGYEPIDPLLYGLDDDEDAQDDD